MKRYFLLGLTALGLATLMPSQSNAEDRFRVYVNPGYGQYRPYYYGYDHHRYYRWHRWHRWHHRYYYERD